MIASQTHRAGRFRTLSTPRALAFVTLAVVAIDELTKVLARAFLPFADQIDGRGPRVAGVIGLERVRNWGSAARFAQGRSLWLVVALGALVVTCLYGVEREGGGDPMKTRIKRAALAAVPLAAFVALAAPRISF